MGSKNYWPPCYGFRLSNIIPTYKCRNYRFQKSFYPDGINSWNNIGPEFREIPTLKLFKSAVLKIIRPSKKSLYNIHNSVGIKYIYQLRVGLSSLKAHKKAHKFIDTLDDNCSCSTGREDNSHFFLKCPYFNHHREKMFSTVNPILSRLYNLSEIDRLKLINILLYGDKKLNEHENRKILRACIQFILNSNRFSDPDQ